jgi:hypothetical protein
MRMFLAYLRGEPRVCSMLQALAVEDLNVKAMVKAPTLAKAISDAGWGCLTVFANTKRNERHSSFCESGDFFRRPRRAFVAGAAATSCRCPFANGHVLDAALSTTGTRTPRRTSASKPIVYGPLEEGLLLVEAMSDMGVGASWCIVQLPLRPAPRPKDAQITRGIVDETLSASCACCHLAGRCFCSQCNCRRKMRCLRR